MENLSAKLAQDQQLDGSSAKIELTQRWFMGQAQDCGDTIVAQFPLEIGTETRYVRVEIVKAELLRGNIEWSQV